MSNIRAEFGGRVRDLRKARNWSQEKLGEAANLHPTYVGAVERGERNISLEYICKLAAAFEIDVSELFKFAPAAEKQHDALRMRITAGMAKLDDGSLRFLLAFQERLYEFRKEIAEEEKSVKDGIE